MTEPKDFYKVIEFADILRVHPNTILRMIKSGRIQALKIGDGKRSDYRIPNTEINRMCEMDMKKLIKNMMESMLEERKE